MSMVVIRKHGRDWKNRNPVLRANEIGLEANTGRIKIGNNKTPWNSLPFVDQRADSDPGDYTPPEVLDGGTP